MKSTMIVKSIENETKAKITISTVYSGCDKLNEFSAIKNLFSDSGMVWNNKTGEYEIEIEATQEKAQVFVDYAAKKQLQIVCL